MLKKAIKKKKIFNPFYAKKTNLKKKFLNPLIPRVSAKKKARAYSARFFFSLFFCLQKVGDQK